MMHGRYEGEVTYMRIAVEDENKAQLKPKFAAACDFIGLYLPLSHQPRGVILSCLHPQKVRSHHRMAAC